MQHYVGLSEAELRTKRQEVGMYYDPRLLINSHMLIAGMSGAGKSFQVSHLLTSAIQAGIEIDVLDPHDEFHHLTDASVSRFSQATNYGYNPLVLDLDPHNGGINRQVGLFVRLIKEVTPGFGVKQEAALRNLLFDTYAVFGITQDNITSWDRHSIKETQRTSLIEKGRDEDRLSKSYPTIEDLIAFAREKIIGLTIGADNVCVTAFENLTRVKKRLNLLLNNRNKEINSEEKDKLDVQIDKIKGKCIDVYTAFIEAMESGREIDDVLKYDSVEVLTSVIQRVTLMNSTGVLSANPPPFGEHRVRVHQIKSILKEEQVLYVKLRLQHIFDKCKQAGPVPAGSMPRHIVFIDEAHNYFKGSSDDIIEVISREARKFGIGLWCASQDPTVFPDAFLTNVGATIFLGIHTSIWKRASSMFRISEKQLQDLKPKEVMAVKFLRDGHVDPPFTNIIVPNPNSALGLRAANFAA